MAFVKLNGGAGRVLCATAAMKAGGHTGITGAYFDMFTGTGIPVIEDNSRYLPHLINDDIVEPEPYYVHKFRTGQWNLVEAFDYLLNGEVNNERPYIHINKKRVEMIRKDIVPKAGGKLVVIQPFGSDRSVETHGRDMTMEQLLDLIAVLNGDGFTPMIMGNDLEDLKKVLQQNDGQYECQPLIAESLPDLFHHIAAADYFIGIDSFGVHIAAGAGVRGALILGATANKKYYPDLFMEFRPDQPVAESTPRLWEEFDLTDMVTNFGVMDRKLAYDVILDDINLVLE